MSRTIHPVEREIDRIRIEIYEETKHMTIEEKNEYFRKSGEEIEKKYGLKTVPSAGRSNMKTNKTD